MHVSSYVFDVEFSYCKPVLLSFESQYTISVNFSSPDRNASVVRRLAAQNYL